MIRLNARFALEESAHDHLGGIPYRRAQDIFIQLYEESLGTIDEELNLRSVYATGRSDYVRNVLRSSKKPDNACIKGGLREPNPDEKLEDRCPYRQHPWCTAARVLIVNGEDMIDEHEVYPLCFGLIYCDGQWWDSF